MLRRVEITIASSGPLRAWLKVADQNESRVNRGCCNGRSAAKARPQPYPSAAIGASSGLRRQFMRKAAYVAAVVLFFASYAYINGSFGSGTLVDKARRDEVALVEKDDPDM